MIKHDISQSDFADRLAILDLVQEYSHCADRRLIDQHLSLFTADARFVIHMQGAGSEPTHVIDGRDNLKPYFQIVDNYQVTQHFLGQCTVVLGRDSASGETYCTAYHVYIEDGERKLMTAHLRYLDKFAKINGAWKFAERKLYIDWIEPLHQSPDVIQHLPNDGQIDAL